jgi:predicted nucleotidyltransferase component of viral defense system
VGKTYTTPTAFKTAIKQAALNMSKKTGMSVPELQNVFYFNRLAARVFTTDPDGWLIKGGQALLVRYHGSARLSRDLDLQSAAPERTVEEAAKMLIEAATCDLGDSLRYIPGKFSPHGEEGRGGAQYFTVYVGSSKQADIKVDLVVGRTLAGAPETHPLTPAVDLQWPVDWPQVRLYPVIDHVADKICAMYERHGKGGSSRYRDLADLLLISQQEHIDGKAVHQALHQEAERRRQLGKVLELPKVFETPAPDWPDNYPEQAKLVLGLKGCRLFPEAAAAASTFINPLLDSSVEGSWNPEAAQWL